MWLANEIQIPVISWHMYILGEQLTDETVVDAVGIGS